MLRRGTPNISYYLIDDICDFLVNKKTKPFLGDKFGEDSRKHGRKNSQRQTNRTQPKRKRRRRRKDTQILHGRKTNRLHKETLQSVPLTEISNFTSNAILHPDEISFTAIAVHPDEILHPNDIQQ